MTMALCFNCGHTKFGAICPCPECSVASTGDMDLDIAFSDHRMSVATLGAFGEVVRAIRRVCEDDQLRFWSFIRFVSVNHPEVLGVNMPADQQAECDAVLARASPLPVTIEEAGVALLMREREQRDDSA
ncbi:MAG: hypothetical protein JWO38_4430 [Gemmataceae bacterium]|nr:hypothetical protein [Gemmataceae bacterium]